MSPSVRMSVRPLAASALPQDHPSRRSSVTVIELRNEDEDSRQASPERQDVTDDDETIHSGGEGTEVNTHIFV